MSMTKVQKQFIRDIMQLIPNCDDILMFYPVPDSDGNLLVIYSGEELEVNVALVNLYHKVLHWSKSANS